MKRETEIVEGMRGTHHWLKLTLVAAVTIVLTHALSGCNTMHGLGKDVEKAGEAIQKSTK